MTLLNVLQGHSWRTDLRKNGAVYATESRKSGCKGIAGTLVGHGLKLT